MEPDVTEWVTIAAAARRLGISRAAVYGRIKRGSAVARRGNSGLEVRWPLAETPRPDDATLRATAMQRDTLRELHGLQEQLLAAVTRAARAEGELVGEKRLTAAMGAELADMRARLDRAELPFWRRWRRR